MKLLTLSLLAHYAAAATYGVTKEYSGTNFFDGWDFYDHHDDKMNGDVEFVSKEAGVSEKLAYVDPGTKHAIIKVDNVTQIHGNWDDGTGGEKRKSVRITTQESYAVGSLWIADIYHAPYGCSVWPSWWSYAAKAQWPAGGEIDVFEGINQATSSQMGLHTTPGCSQKSPNQISTLVNTTDCAGDNNSGCILTSTDPASYGPAFAAAQGGVFVTEFAETGISIWFMSRKNIPESLLTTKTIDTSTLGKPMGNWPASGCDINKFFEPQNLVFTITLCGDFAGPPALFQQTCTGKCYDDWVVKDPKYYSNAYFEIGSVRVFRDTTLPASGGSGSGGSSGPGSGGSSSGNNTSGNNNGTNSAHVVTPWNWSIPTVAGIVSALAGLLL